MTGPYTITLDDGTGTFPYDISSYVDTNAGFQITVGRTNEFGEVQPSTLAMTLDNSDGRFTQGGGNDVYLIHVDQMIRVTCTVGATTSNRFTGYVSSWPVAWPGGKDYAEVQITANDRLARLSRRTFRSVVQETILQSTPVAYYTLAEAQGSNNAGDISGNQAAALSQANAGTGVAGPTFTTAIAFGQGSPLAPYNATDNGTTTYFNPSSEANGKYLTGTLAADFTGATAAIHVTMYTGTVPSAQTIMAAITDSSGNGIGVGVNTSGDVCAYTLAAHVPTVAVTGGSVHDDATHDVVLTPTTLYLDDASQGTYTQTSRTYHTLWIGGTSNGNCYTQTLSHVAFFNAAPTTQAVADMHNAVNNGFIADTTDARVARYATWANIATGDQSLETGTVTTVAHQDTEGMDALTAIQNVVDTEIGLEFIDGLGKLVFQARSHRALATSVMSMDTTQVGEDTQFLLDNQFLINYATVSRPLGPTLVAKDTSSITTHERYEWDATVLTTNDTDSNSIATQRVNIYAEPLIRVPNLLVDALTENSTFQASLIQVALSDLITLTGLPSQAPAGTTFQLFVEGWTETYSLTEWSIEFNTSPNVQFAASGGVLSWLLGNATYSVLGTTTVLS